MSSTGTAITINISPGQFIATPTSFNTPLVVTRETATLANGQNFQVISSLSQLTALDTTNVYKMVRDILSSTPKVSNVGVLVLAPGDDVGDELTALLGTDWYHILYANSAETANELSDIKNISDFAQANMKQFFVALTGTATAASAIISDSSNANSIIGNNRTLALFHQDITEHIEAPWVSRVMSYPEVGREGFAPARSGTNFAGKTPDTFSLTKSQDIEMKNGNMYIQEGGLNFIDHSYMLNDFSLSLETTAQQVLQRDWIVANTRSTIRTFFQSSRVPRYTDADIVMLGTLLKDRVFDVAGARGFIDGITTSDQAAASTSALYRYNLRLPTRAEVERTAPQNIKTGLLSGVQLDYYEAGFFDKVQINISYL